VFIMTSGRDRDHFGATFNKQDSVDDILTAAEWLIEKCYTTPERMAVRITSRSKRASPAQKITESANRLAYLVYALDI